AVLSSEPTSVLNWTVFPARGWPLRFPTNAVMPARWPGEIEFGLTATWILISAEVLANPVVGAGLPAHWDRTFTPPLSSRHSNRGPVAPLLSEHAWISVPATRRSPRTTRVHGRTAQGRRRLARGGDSLASMILAP